jgi:hypothetical protein
MHRTSTVLIPTLLILIAHPAMTPAQELDCTVQVNYEAVPATNKESLHGFAADLKDYLNNYKWGSDNLSEKVKCTFNIFVQGATGDDKYTAQMFVGSQRQMYGSERSTAELRVFDESWEFTYVKGRPITHNPYTFNDLASFLDFYVYLILGYDYDTYEALSGTQFFQKSSDIASLGRSSGQKGWQPTTGSYNRVQLIDELLSPKFEVIRKALYQYHFAGLDSLGVSKERALANILNAIDMIGATKKEVDPRNIVIKTFFDTKYLEIADLFAGYSDPAVYVRFSTIDPTHQKTYEEYRQRRN